MPQPKFQPYQHIKISGNRLPERSPELPKSRYRIRFSFFTLGGRRFCVHELG